MDFFNLRRNTCGGNELNKRERYTTLHCTADLMLAKLFDERLMGEKFDVFDKVVGARLCASPGDSLSVLGLTRVDALEDAQPPEGDSESICTRESGVPEVG